MKVSLGCFLSLQTFIETDEFGNVVTGSGTGTDSQVCQWNELMDFIV